jgi:hypothetical protein
LETRVKRLGPVSGYCYKLQAPDNKKGLAWQTASDERWDIKVYTPTGHETLLGSRWIDGAEVFVFRSGDKAIAQSAVNVRAGK